MAFIHIIPDDNQTFQWRYTDPDTNQTFDETVFTLRQIPRSEARRLEQKHTKVTFRRGQRNSDMDVGSFADDAIDMAIVGWENLKGMRTRPDGAAEEYDVECTRSNKLRLPESVKLEISRICINRSAEGVEADDLVGPERPTTATATATTKTDPSTT